MHAYYGKYCFDSKIYVLVILKSREWCGSSHEFMGINYEGMKELIQFVDGISDRGGWLAVVAMKELSIH